MSIAMIIRRGGGGGEGFDSNGAVLKVITSTGCTVLVTGTGYSNTHQQADGFTRSSDSNVTEHFFSIPASAFGTITVKATNTYGDNTKTITVSTAGKVYELRCGGINIILNSTFGLQSGLTCASGVTYDERNKVINISYAGGWLFIGDPSNADAIPVIASTKITCTAASAVQGGSLTLRDRGSTTLATMSWDKASTLGTQTVDITNRYYNKANIYHDGMSSITQIVLS